LVTGGFLQNGPYSIVSSVAAGWNTPTTTMNTVRRFCKLSNLRYLAIGSAISGVGSSLSGRVVLFERSDYKFDQPLTETVIHSFSTIALIANCIPGNGAFITSHISSTVQHIAFYSQITGSFFESSVNPYSLNFVTDIVELPEIGFCVTANDIPNSSSFMEIN
jgi:hypothetical protein